MHPAFSVILLTTLIGAGQGLFLALVTGQVYASIKLIAAQDASFYVGGSVLVFILLLTGLLSSFFHLGRPERAWRAMMKWRTSWLSREVIILPKLMLFVALYGAVHWLGWTKPLFIAGADALPIDASFILGVIGAVLAFALFAATAMIYASVRFIAEWHSAWTVANFTLLGLGSGFMLAAAYSAALGNHLVTFYGTWAVIFTLMALVTRGTAWWHNLHLTGKSNLQTAIGIRHRSITQRAQGFTGSSFNTREFFHHASPHTIQQMRYGFLVLAFPVPVIFIGIAYITQSTTLPLLAFALQYAGLLAERWLFFIEANHPQNLYYQSVA